MKKMGKILVLTRGTRDIQGGQESVHGRAAGKKNRKDLRRETSSLRSSGTFMLIERFHKGTILGQLINLATR